MCREALRNTLRFFGWNRKTVLKLIVPAIVALTIVYSLRGWEEVRGEISYSVAFGFGGTAVVFIGLFFWYLIKAYHYREFRRDLWPEVKADIYGDEQRVIRVNVKNVSSSLMKDCYGKLVGCSFVKESRGARTSREFCEWYFPPLNHYFPWFLHQTRGSIDIEPGSSESLEVLTCFRRSQNLYYTCTLGGIDHQRKYVSDCEYIIEIGWMFREAERMKVKLTFTEDECGVNIKEGLKIESC